MVFGQNVINVIIRARDEFSRTFSKANLSMKSFQRAALGMGVAGVAIGAVLFKAGQASSDLGESINAVNVVFKKFGDEASKKIQEFGKISAKEVGLSTRAFNEGAVRFSAFASKIAEGGGDVSDTVIEITKRTADFASVMNIDLARAQTLVQAGLAGETEGLRRFGIDVSAATVKAFAFANGIGVAGEELNETQKIQARFGLIMEQTADTAGDFKNTSDDLANSTRIMKAEFENTAASIGETIEPILKTLVNIVRKVIKFFNSLPEPLRQAIIIFLAVTAVVLVLAAAVAFLTAALSPFILIAVAIAAVVTGIVLVVKNWGKIMVWLRKKLQPVFDFFKEKFGPQIAAIKMAVKLLGDVFKWLWEKRLKPTWDLFKKFIQWIEEKVLPVIKKIISIIKSIVGVFKKAGDFSAFGGGGGGGNDQVGDAIIRPDGSIIETDPRDTLIATKTPGRIGGTIVVNIEQLIASDAESVADTLQQLLKEKINI